MLRQGDISLCCANDLKSTVPRMRLSGYRLVVVPDACQNFGRAPAMRNFDLSPSKFGSDAPRGHKRRPSQVGPPKRCLRGGFEDQRQMKAWIASRGDPSFFQRFPSSVRAQKKHSQRPAPESQPPIARADLNAETHVFDPGIAIAQHGERRAKSHHSLRVARIHLESLPQDICSPRAVP